MFERGIYEKAGPWQVKIHWRGAVRGLQRAGAWMGPGAGVERKNAPLRAIDRGGAGIEVGAHRFRGPRGPVTNTSVESSLQEPYLYKYLFKSPNRTLVNIISDEFYDKINDYIEAWYLSASEAAWRILEYNISRKEPSVKVL